MIAALLLQAAAPATAVEAERAFAAAAARDGQWTAFRRFAEDDAIMFVPDPVNAPTFLKPLRDPPRAIDWWPTASWTSCDGPYAVDTGGWRRPDGAVGFFTTVWRRQPGIDGGGWRWTVDGGGDLRAARPRVARPMERRASCKGEATSPTLDHVEGPTVAATGTSLDRTLRWRWIVTPDGARSFEAWTWNGRGFDRVLADRIPAPAVRR